MLGGVKMKKVALVTGATSGLGLAYAKEYASKGYNLIITGRKEDKIRGNAEDIAKKYKVDVKIIIVDLSNEEGLNQLLCDIKEDEIEVLVNNAGFGLKPEFANTPIEDLNQLMFLQINMVTILTRSILKNMIENNNGTIINISSDGAFAIMPHNVLYSSSKLFIINLTQGIYMELVGTKIKVQVVCPGFMDTDFHKNAGMNIVKKKKGFMSFMQPEKVVELAMKDLKKGKVVSLPGMEPKMIRLFVKLMPQATYYKMGVNFANKRIMKQN